MPSRLIVLIVSAFMCVGSVALANAIAKSLSESPREQEEWMLVLAMCFIVPIAVGTVGLLFFVRIRERNREATLSGTKPPIVKIPRTTQVTLVIMAIVSFAIFIFNAMPDRGPTTDDAEIAARQFVRAKLKDPSSADFGWDKPTIRINEDGNYVVVGKVTSKNSFNADVTSVFTCILRYSEGDWKLEEIAFLNP